jgi:hypothetical protein
VKLADLVEQVQPLANTFARELARAVHAHIEATHDRVAEAALAQLRLELEAPVAKPVRRAQAPRKARTARADSAREQPRDHRPRDLDPAATSYAGPIETPIAPARPHGRDCPDRCSICLGAAARIVALKSGAVVIDGELTDRATQPDPSAARYPRRPKAAAR